MSCRKHEMQERELRNAPYPAIHFEDECPVDVPPCGHCVPRRGPKPRTIDDTPPQQIRIGLPEDFGPFEMGEFDPNKVVATRVAPDSNFWTVPIYPPGGSNPVSVGIKYDDDKPDLSLLPRRPLEEVAHVLMHGAIKYHRDNWRGGFAFSRLTGAALRHIMAFNEGETLDPESGRSHLAHALCMLLFLEEIQRTHPELDDRWKKE